MKQIFPSILENNFENKMILCISIFSFAMVRKVSPESERYEEFPFGYSRIVHTDTCSFTLVFYHGNTSRARQAAP